MTVPNSAADTEWAIACESAHQLAADLAHDTAEAEAAGRVVPWTSGGVSVVTDVQAEADAHLSAAFDSAVAVGREFDYSQVANTDKEVEVNEEPSRQRMAYLERMEKGGTTQAFGALIVAEERTYMVLAASANLGQMLGRDDGGREGLKKEDEKTGQEEAGSGQGAGDGQEGQGQKGQGQASPQDGGRVQSTGEKEEVWARVPGAKSGANGFGVVGLPSGGRVGFAIGKDARVLFEAASVTALELAAAAVGLPVTVPLVLTAAGTGKRLVGSLRRLPVGLAIELEPLVEETGQAGPLGADVAPRGAVEATEAAERALERMQGVRPSDIVGLCQVLVEEVRSLAGYDRTHVYKFHQDEHGEVIAETCCPGLDPILGLHFPATDIPQAARFLFMTERVRMICDCRAPQSRLLQHRSHPGPISLVGSLLRSPHPCHLEYMCNMGSLASLVFPIIVTRELGLDEDVSAGAARGGRTEALGEASPIGTSDSGMEERRRVRQLWGLLVCHHTSPRFTPWAVRSACDQIVQAFAAQLDVELQLCIAIQMKHILRTHLVLADRLASGGPPGLMTGTVSVQDLVHCDGAALLYQGRWWRVGTTPTEEELNSFISWFLRHYPASTGLTTDSLRETGFPHADAISTTACGIAAVRFSFDDMLIWFRKPTEIRWAGSHGRRGAVDDGRRMHPRASFSVLRSVLRWRSSSWEEEEVNAIQALQLLLRDEMQAQEAECRSPTADSRPQVEAADTARGSAVVSIVEGWDAPIFGVDSNGMIVAWNRKLATLTGLPSHLAVDGRLATTVVVSNSWATLSRLLQAAAAADGREGVSAEVKLRLWRHVRASTPPSEGSSRPYGAEEAGPVVAMQGDVEWVDYIRLVVVVCEAGSMGAEGGSFLVVGQEAEEQQQETRKVQR